jgi:hypothetical protein
MFDHLREKRAQKHAAAEAAAAEIAKRAQEAERTAQIAELQALVSIAQGESSPMVDALLMKKGEIGVAQIGRAGLIEEVKGAGHWSGSSQGVSIPIGKIAGRSVRYRVGATKGHYVQGVPVATAVDVGTLSITNQRIVYQGSKKSVECLFSKLLGIQHAPGGITLSVSNRQKTTTVQFGAALDDWLSNRLSIALAMFNDEVGEAVTQLESQIKELEAQTSAPLVSGDVEHRS